MTDQVKAMLIDAVCSVTLLLATRYLSPPDVQFVKELVAILQPVVIAVIAGMHYQEKAILEAETDRLLYTPVTGETQ